MGCSASKPLTLITESAADHQPSSSSPCFSPSSSPSSSSHSSVRVTRALSLPAPVVHHPPLCKGDSQHHVCLTSTTYGSLRLSTTASFRNPGFDVPDPTPSSRLAAGKPRSASPEVADEFLSPDSVINTWELMDGLDDFESGTGSSKSNLNQGDTSGFEFVEKPDLGRSPNSRDVMDSFGTESEKVVSDLPENTPARPLWQHLSEESLLAKMDPIVAFTYLRALSSRQLGHKHANSIARVASIPPGSPSCNGARFHLPGSEDKVVLYCTSLRGVRKTHEDCRSVLMIFRGFRVLVDERDIAMDSAYRRELQRTLGEKAACSLPQVFIGGKYVGGADEIRQLHEAGELALLLKGYSVRDPMFVCERCGDARFLPCFNCNGSRKVFEDEVRRFKRCPNCNENGLVRCPQCRL